MKAQTREWVSQTDLGAAYGLSAIAVGKHLSAAGLKDGRTPTERALDDGYAIPAPLRNGTPNFRWHRGKVLETLDALGLPRVAAPERPTRQRRSRPDSGDAADHAAGSAGLEIWTDGACSGNPGPGGWGWVTNEPAEQRRSGYGSDRATTNSRMEMLAVIEALESVTERPVTVVSDSAYVVDAVTKRWFASWRRNGWQTAAGKPVKNPDLWERMIPLVTSKQSGRLVVSMRRVKGHSGLELNELADALAVRGRNEA